VPWVCAPGRYKYPYALTKHPKLNQVVHDMLLKITEEQHGPAAVERLVEGMEKYCWTFEGIGNQQQFERLLKLNASKWLVSDCNKLDPEIVGFLAVATEVRCLLIRQQMSKNAAMYEGMSWQRAYRTVSRATEESSNEASPGFPWGTEFGLTYDAPELETAVLFVAQHWFETGHWYSPTCGCRRIDGVIEFDYTPVFVVKLKKEFHKRERSRDGKIRAYASAPVHYNVVMHYCYGELLALMSALHSYGQGGMLVGHTPESYVYAVERLKQQGSVQADDASQMDANCHPQLTAYGGLVMEQYAVYPLKLRLLYRQTYVEPIVKLLLCENGKGVIYPYNGWGTLSGIVDTQVSSTVRLALWRDAAFLYHNPQAAPHQLEQNIKQRLHCGDDTAFLGDALYMPGLVFSVPNSGPDFLSKRSIALACKCQSSRPEKLLLRLCYQDKYLNEALISVLQELRGAEQYQKLLLALRKGLVAARVVVGQSDPRIWQETTASPAAVGALA